MAESKLVQLHYIFSRLSLGQILISDLVVTNLFMYSLPGNDSTLLGSVFLHQRYRLKHIMLLKLPIILLLIFTYYSQPSTVNLCNCATRTTISYL